MTGGHTLTLLSREGRSFVELPELKVIARSPKQPEKTLPLELSRLVVGTAAEADLTLVDPSVSHLHCELSRVPSGIRVCDLGSKNGTRLQGTWLADAVVPPGTRLQLGNSTLLFKPGRKVQELALSDHAQLGDAVGKSLVMRALFARLEALASREDTVLLLGESGTGKEVLAQAIHDTSPRRDGPFIVFDCGSVSSNLVEAELFGYRKGAFTGAMRDSPGLFAQAQGGTLFIDEVGDLPVELQPRLLRALEQRQVRPLGGAEVLDLDVRVVAATHRDIRARIAEGHFRADLYYRLAGAEILVPPLRDRVEDIPLLASRFLGAAVPPRRLSDLAPTVLPMLERYAWPGNVRELKNVCARLGVFGELGALSASQVTTTPPARLPGLLEQPWKQARDEALASFESEYLKAVLKRCGGNVSAMSREMGISRQLAHRLLARYGLRSREE